MSWQRCSRILLTKPKTSSLCSMCIMSIMLSMTMNVPVLPTPALWKRGKKAQGLVFNKQPECSEETKTCDIVSILYKSLLSRSHNIMIYLSPYYPCVLNIDVDCGQPQACVKVLHLWSPNTLLIDLQGSFQQTAPLGAASRDSTAGRWSLFNGPHSRTTVPLPEHLLQQLPQSAADFFGEASRWSSRQTRAHTSSGLFKHNIDAYLTSR